MISAVARAQIGERRGWLRFSNPRSSIVADRLDEVRPALERIEAEVNAGRWAVGLVSYDAGPAFDMAIRSHRDATVPLVHFGIFDPSNVAESDPVGGSFWLGPRRPLISRNNFEEGVRSVHRFIEAGDTYQVNLTLRLGARFAGDPEGLFAALATAQQGEHEALLDLGDTAVCSASPELFFTHHANGSLVSKPMKGTRPAGTPHEELTGSLKDQAENTMIVDMMRNDFGRIAEIGSVEVPKLHEVEEYPTVIQMTSTVTARSKVGLADLFAATFPPASITGAPKIRTTEIITELETQPRGVYTGSIGVLAPSLPGAGIERRSEWNVAIRTVWIDKAAGRATYGVGGGIVWDSDPAEEWNETRVKSRVLLHADQKFELIESLRFSPDEPSLADDHGYWLLDLHLDRLLRSAEFFQFRFDPEYIRAELVDMHPPSAAKVRLLLNPSGGVSITHAPLGATGHFGLEPPTAGIRKPVVIDSVPVMANDPFLAHKTTHRTIYDRAGARNAGAADVILVNSTGCVTESLSANLVIRDDSGRLLTPPSSSGLLPGVFRRHLLVNTALLEEPITTDELRRAADQANAWLINSVRGWVPLTLT
ncbi:MAG: aminodeoxychorismate synthase, component I [Acidimicrobiales bacterium]|nr:aminodeoxychorismate synthase, component I [Acidimicrobiales bacterium]